MRSPCLRCLAVFAAAAALSRAAPFDDRVESLFRPPVGELVALSPDGQRLAYTTRTRDGLAIVIAPLDSPGPRRTIPVETTPAPSLASSPPSTPSSASAPALSSPSALASSSAFSPPAPLRFLRWATPNRLIYAPAERIVPLPPVLDPSGRASPNPDGPTILAPIFAVDADGSSRGLLVDARDFQETPAEAVQSLADLLRTPEELAAKRRGPVHWRMPHLDILGFHPRDREQLIVSTRGAYSMPMQYLVDTRRASVRAFGDEWPAPPPEPAVYDWFRLKVVGERTPAARPATAWQDADLARLQRDLAAKFPRRIVELLDWSDNRLRLLLRVTGGTDPGRVFLYQRTEDLVLELFPHAPWLTAAKLSETRWFEFDTPAGVRLSGYLTSPARSSTQLRPPPLLLVFPTGFPGCAQPAFDPEAQALADLGFAVARLNHRCVAGLRPEDLPALRTAPDRLAADDARAALDWLAARHPDRPFDPRRIATLGRGYGGYLALRALQLQPATFRCGIAIDAPLDLTPVLPAPTAANRPPPPPSSVATAPLASSLPPAPDLPATLPDPATADVKTLSVLANADSLTAPLLLLVEPAREPAIDTATAELRARLTQLGRPPDHLALDPGFAAARPAARATAYRKIEEFLNRNLNTPTVKIGSTEVVK